MFADLRGRGPVLRVATQRVTLLPDGERGVVCYFSDVTGTDAGGTGSA